MRAEEDKSDASQATTRPLCRHPADAVPACEIIHRANKTGRMFCVADAVLKNG